MTNESKCADVLRSFRIEQPDADGLIWLVIEGQGTSANAMFNLGHLDRLAAKVALELEKDRVAALLGVPK